MMTHTLLVGCALWAAICLSVQTWRAVRGWPEQGYIQSLSFIALILALGFLELAA